MERLTPVIIIIEVLLVSKYRLFIEFMHGQFYIMFI